MKLLTISIAVVLTIPARAADKVTYNDHVLPIFRNACLNCHNPDKKKAGLDLSTYQGALQGSENGKVLESGNLAGSLLLKCVKQIEDPKMPPKGEKLTDADIAILEKWVAGQLLETATGKAVAASNNNVQVAVVSLERPEGPPPMPGDLPLEPFVRTSRNNALTALAASPWAPLVAIGGQKQIILYNTETFDPLGILPFPEGFPTIIRFSRNGQVLLTGGGLGGKSGKVVLWDVKSGDRIAAIGNEFDQVLAADLSADQQFVALGGPGKLVKIYATKDGKLLHSIKKHTDWVTGIAYSPDGKFLATADRNGGIQIWEGSTGKEYNALAGHKVMVTSLAFLTGVLASASEDGTVKLWDVKEGKEIKSWQAHAGGTAWVDFTPDGRLVSCGRDKTARVWDQTGKKLGEMKEPFSDIALRVALSSEHIIAGDWTGEIRVCSLDGTRLGDLNANPPPLADRLAAAQKRLADAQPALHSLEQQSVAAAQKVSAEKAAAEQTAKAELAAKEEARKADAAALEAAKAALAGTEKRLAEENAQLAELRKTRDAANLFDRPDAQQKVDAQKGRIAQIETELATAKKANEARLAEAGKSQPPAVAPAELAESTKKLEQQNAELAKLREIRASKTAGTPEFAEADKKVQAKKGEIEEAQKLLAAAQKNPALAPAATKPTAAAEALTKAKAAIDQTVAQIKTATLEVQKWTRAQAFMTVHNARQSLAEKQTRYEELVATVKDALLPGEKAQADLAAAEKGLAEAPAQIKEKETLFAQAAQAAEMLSKGVGVAESALAAKEAAAKAATEAFDKTKSSVAELTKTLEQRSAEVTKLRELRATKPAGSPEYAEADAKVQAKKAEIAQTQATLEPMQTKLNELKSETEPLRADALKAHEALEKARADAKAATDKVGAAEKALADARKNAEQGGALLEKLRKEVPEIIKTAQATKSKAEQDTNAAAKELEGAKTQFEHVRLEYEARWKPSEKSASVAPAEKPKS